MKTLLFSLLFLVLASPLRAAAPLTLEEAVATALSRHPTVAQAREEVAGAEARVGRSRAAYFPQVDLAADWSRGRTFLTALEGVKETEVFSAGVAVRQNLWDFGRTAGAVAAARGDREAAAQGEAATRQEVVLRVRSAYYLQFAAEEQVEAIRERVRAREAVLRQAQGFFAEGIRPRVEVARAEADLHAARTELIRAENNRDLARLELAQAMGVEALEERPLSEPPYPQAPLPGLAAAREEALRGRAELREARARIDAAEGALRTARSGHLPTLSATGSAGYADRELWPEGNTWSAGVHLTVPLFSGFATVEEVREGRARVRGAEARRQELRLAVAREVESAWLGVREARARLDSTRKEVAAARENRSLAAGRYREGVGNMVEVTDAEAQALSAETAHIQARYDALTAEARLRRAMGREE